MNSEVRAVLARSMGGRKDVGAVSGEYFFEILGRYPEASSVKARRANS
jgi:hypothetical protein